MEIVEYTVDDDDLPEEERLEMERWGEKTCLSVPLFFRDEIIGCLDLIERRWVRHFTHEELEALRPSPSRPPSPSTTPASTGRNRTGRSSSRR